MQRRSDRMRTLYTVAFLVAPLLVVAPSSYGDGRPVRTQFHADLDGTQEIPGPIDTPATGRFRIRFNSDLSEATFVLHVFEGIRVTQAHIHCGPVGQAGPIVAFLAGFQDRGWDVDGRWVSNTVLTDENIIPTTPAQNPTCPNTIQTLADLRQAIEDGNGYVNVHTVAHPPGEIRGHLGGR
jgi:hypothetical protein